VLNVTALEDIFAKFHGELDTWLQGESAKLQRVEAKGDAAQETLRSSANLVCDFVRDHAPQTYSDLGPDPPGEGFTTKALPSFLEIVDQDGKALEEICSLLGEFADRRFPKNEELANLKADSSPLPLLRAILRMLAAQPKGQEAGSRRGRRRRREGDQPGAPAAEPATTTAAAPAGKARGGGNCSESDDGSR